MKILSFSVLFITLFLIFSLCIFIPVLSEYGYVATYTPSSYNYIDINSSTFAWPTPRLYYYYF